MSTLAIKTLAALFASALLFPKCAAAQATPEPTPAPKQSAAPSTGGAFDASKLTPKQQAAIRLAIIKASQNPVGNIAALPIQVNNNYGLGPYTRYQFNLTIQPVMPIWIDRQVTLIARTIFPIYNQPSSAPPAVCASVAGCGSTFGLSDVQEQLFFAPKTKPGALIWGAGPMLQFPTASPDVLGTGKWAAGPAAVALVMPGPWVVGMLVTQIWSFTGKADRPNVNAGLFQPFINYNLPGDRFSVVTAPIITVDYTAPGNQKWTVPVGGGVGYTFKLGDQLMQLSALYYTDVVRPLNAPQTTLRLNWSLLFPLTRGIDLQQIIKENTK